MIKRDVRIKSIYFAGAVQHCAHACTYCSIGDKAKTRLPFDRFISLMERLAQWQLQPNTRNVDISPRFYYNFGYGADVARQIEPINLAFGVGRFESITTGGLRLLDQDQSRAWLDEWRTLGVKTVHASFAGIGALHDSYNGRKGDFDYLLMLQTIAAELGMRLRQSLFLTKQTAPQIHDLINRLDLIDGALDWRLVFPPAYYGHGRDLEADRITEDERDTLPVALQGLRLPHFEMWRSEREWLEELEKEELQSEEVSCTVHVDVQTINDFESMSSDEIIDSLIERAAAAYRAIPPLRELARDFGDRENRRIYLQRYEVEKLLVDRFLVTSPVTFERSLTDL